jgi:GAF domain-containing protein
VPPDATDYLGVALPTVPPVDVSDLAELAADRSQSTIAGLLRAARGQLGLEVALLAELTGEAQVYRAVDGDGASFGLLVDHAIALEESYCHHVVNGRLPNVMRDVRSHPIAGDMAITASTAVGAYVSVPIHLSDGRLWGTLCAGSHGEAPWLRERDVEFLHVLARLIGDELEREELEARVQRLTARLAELQAA